MRSVDAAVTFTRKRLTLGGGCLLRKPSGGEINLRIAFSIPRRRHVPELWPIVRWRRETVVACVIKEIRLELMDLIGVTLMLGPADLTRSL